MDGSILFVTGTDTDVGKTVATAWLGWALSERAGRRVALLKPFQTGTTDPAADGDEALYRQALPETATIQTLSTLPEPLAPSIAAERAGATLSPDDAVRACREIAASHDVTLVEGAGGLIVSITATVDMAGLAGALDAPLVLVARPALGTLNHTLLSVEAAERRGLDVVLLVVSGYGQPPTVVEAENLRYFRERLPSIPMLVLGRSDPSSDQFPERMPAWIDGDPPAFLSGVMIDPLDVAEEVAQARWPSGEA